MIPAAIAALCAAGVMLLGSGIYRLSHRGATARRVADVVGERRSPSEPLRVHVPGALRLEVGQLAGQIEAHGEWLRGPVVILACLCALVGLGSVSLPWIVLAALCALAGYALGARSRRRARIEAQALAAMDLLASGLRAGYSVPQAIELVARHISEPSASEFELAAREIALGVPLFEAIARLARRNANKDYELVAIIIRVQHEVGGNLAQILDSVSSTLRERLELRRQVNALTAQQRLSSMVLTVLPFALLLFLFITDRSFVEPMFTAPLGRLMLAVAGAMVFIGWTVMRSVGRVQV
jgi:tight adherence protein B